MDRWRKSPGLLGSPALCRTGVLANPGGEASALRAWRRWVAACAGFWLVAASLAVAPQAADAQIQHLNSVQFSPGSILAQLHPATWTVTMTVAENVYSTDTFTLSGPPLSDGFQWGSLASEYSATVTAGATSTPVAVSFPSGGPYELPTVTLSLGSGSGTVAPAGSTVSITVQQCTNPGAGSYPASDFTAQVDSDTPISPAQGYTFGNPTTTTNATTDNLVAGATANWSIGFASPASLAAGAGTLSLTGPLGLPSAASAYTLADTTAGGPAQHPAAIATLAGGVQLTVPFAVYSGDSLDIGIAGATNPPINDLNGGQFFPGSFQIAVSGSGLPIYVENSGAVLISGQPGVTASMSSPVEGVSGVTWTVGFPAEAVLAAGDTITLGESLPGAAFPSDTGDYTITAGGGVPLQPSSAVPSAGGTGAQVVLTLPPGTSIPLQAQVSVQARAVANPTTGGAVTVSVATSRTPAGTVVPAVSFVPPATTPGSGTTSTGPAQTAQVHLAGTAVPLPPEPLPPLSTSPNTPAALEFGAVCQNSYCGGNLYLVAQSTVVNNTSIFIDPSRTVTIPVLNTTNVTGAYSNSSNITADTICASATENGQSVQLACVDNLAPGAQSNLQFTLPGLAASVTFTATATGINNPSNSVTATPTGGSPGPVEIVQSPTAMEELNVLPFKILYQPPGDQSTSQYTLSQGSSSAADYSLTNSQSNAQSSEQDISLSVDAGVQAGGFSADLTASAGWDTTTTNTVSSSQTTDKGVTFSTTNTQTWQAGPDSALDTPGTQPWTGDQFVLLVHPQFAVWDNITCSSGVPSAQGGCTGGGQQGQIAYAMTGANPSFLTVSAGQLATCAQGTPLAPPQTYTPRVVLEPNECLSLLQLDPFAATGSQSVNPQNSLGDLVTQVQTYSATSATTSTQITLDQQTASTLKTSSDTSFSSEVDSLFTTSASATVGYSGGIGSLASGSASVGFSYSSNTGNDVTQTVDVQQSQTSTSTVEQAASASLSDSAHPLATTIYLDSRWDTLMFQVDAPVVSTVSPSSGSPGMALAIGGSGFTSGPMTVRFCPAGGGGCTTATSPSAQSSDVATAVVPAGLGAGTYVVQVVTSGGPSQALCASGSACADFTVLPTITTSGANVASLSPATGPNGGGTPVTITGSDLAGVTAVWFGVSDPSQNPGDLQQFQQSGKAGPPPIAPAPAFRVVNSTEILACAPAVSATGTLWVSVLGANGWSPVTPGDAFTYTAGAAAGTCDQATLVGPPTVTSLSPATGPAQGGSSITVNGANFQDMVVTAPCDTAGCPAGGTVSLLEPPPVDFCALTGSPCAPGTDVNLIDSGRLSVQVPSGSGIVDVLVGGAAGFSQPVAADEYTYTPGTACTACGGPGSISLTSAPASVAAGPGEAAITATVLNAQDLPVPDTAVIFSAPGGQFTVTAAVYTNAAGVAQDTLQTGSPGTVTVNAIVPGATELENQIGPQFLPLPVVTGLSPTSGSMSGGNQITVQGLGFTGATAVDFGGTSVPVAASAVNGTGTAVTVTAPPGSGTVDVRVQNAAVLSGTGSADRYTYVTGSLLAPQIMGLSPTAGPSAGGTSVTISGSGFTGTTAVYFGSTSVPFTVVNAGEIQVTAPPGSGSVTVSVGNAHGTSAPVAADQFTYTTPLQPVTRTLSAGWNTLSIPFALASTSLAQILSDHGASLLVAYAYAGGGWVQVTSANQAQVLSQPMTGLFLDLAAGASVTATLTPASTPNPPPTLSLEPGWNLVGPSSPSGPQTYANFLTGVAPADVPLLVDPNGTPTATTDPSAETGLQVAPGHAYWLYAAAPGQVLLGQAATGSTNP